LWLQKGHHDFDYINQIADARPTAVAAMGSRRIYGGDRACGLQTHGLGVRSGGGPCPESPQNTRPVAKTAVWDRAITPDAFSESIKLMIQPPR